MSEARSLEDLLDRIAAGLAGRIRSLSLIIDRLDRLEAGTGEWLSGLNEEALAEEAKTFTLRALKIISDPDTYGILQTLSTAESFPISQLAEDTGMGRIGLNERLNDLVQIGFATRMIDTDHAQISAAGANAVELVAEIAGETAKQYTILSNE